MTISANTPSVFFAYCDASFSKKDGLAVIGYAIFRSQKEHDEILLAKKEITLTEIDETNNIRAEIRGALAVLEAIPPCSNLTLFTDCQTICDLPERRMKLEGSEFVSESKNAELANADLYRKFYSLYARHKVDIVWIKGHSPNRQGNVQKNFSHLDKEVRKRLRAAVKS